MPILTLVVCVANPRSKRQGKMLLHIDRIFYWNGLDLIEIDYLYTHGYRLILKGAPMLASSMDRASGGA